MAFESEFLELFPHTVILKAPTGRNAQGGWTYGGAVEKRYPARIVGQRASLRDGKSTQESPQFVVYVACGSDLITTNYNFDWDTTNASEYTGFGYPFIYSVMRYPDEEGAHHVKLILGFQFHHQSAV